MHLHEHNELLGPLASILEEENKEVEETSTKQVLLATYQPATSKIKESMVVDSGATSHFATETINLPHTGQTSIKQVCLPDGNIIRGSHKAVLPNSKLPVAAKQVDVLPDLQKSLFSIGKVADEGYTTVFCPRNEGVTIHREGTIIITKTEEADLQGWRAETGLWELDPNENKNQAIKLCLKHQTSLTMH